jgi:hypothetical protein
MDKGKSILSFFSRVAVNGKSSITEPFEKTIEMAALTATEQESSATEDSTHLSEGTALSLTTKQRNAHDKFAREIKDTTGLLLIPGPCNNGRLTSQCCECLKNANATTVIRNVRDRWEKHAKVCPGLMLSRKNSLFAQAQQPLSAEAQAFVMHITAGGERHRQQTCDAYVLTYWIYKHKLPFTTGDKLKEVDTILCDFGNKVVCSSF